MRVFPRVGTIAIAIEAVYSIEDHDANLRYHAGLEVAGSALGVMDRRRPIQAREVEPFLWLCPRHDSRKAEQEQTSSASLLDPRTQQEMAHGAEVPRAYQQSCRHRLGHLFRRVPTLTGFPNLLR